MHLAVIHRLAFSPLLVLRTTYNFFIDLQSIIPAFIIGHRSANAQAGHFVEALVFYFYGLESSQEL